MMLTPEHFRYSKAGEGKIYLSHVVFLLLYCVYAFISVSFSFIQSLEHIYISIFIACSFGASLVSYFYLLKWQLTIKLWPKFLIYIDAIFLLTMLLFPSFYGPLNVVKGEGVYRVNNGIIVVFILLAICILYMISLYVLFLVYKGDKKKFIPASFQAFFNKAVFNTFDEVSRLALLLKEESNTVPSMWIDRTRLYLANENSVFYASLFKLKIALACQSFLESYDTLDFYFELFKQGVQDLYKGVKKEDLYLYKLLPPKEGSKHHILSFVFYFLLLISLPLLHLAYGDALLTFLSYTLYSVCYLFMAYFRLVVRREHAYMGGFSFDNLYHHLDGYSFFCAFIYFNPFFAYEAYYLSTQYLVFLIIGEVILGGLFIVLISLYHRCCYQYETKK